MIATQQYILIDQKQDVNKMVEAYRKRGEPVCFDVESTGFDSRKGKLITLQFMQLNQTPVIIDMRHWERKEWWAAANSLSYLFDGSLLIVGWNLKFDYQWLLNHLNIRIRRLFDGMLAEQLIYGLGVSEGKSKGTEFNLKAAAQRRGLTVSKEERNWFVDLDQREDEWNAPLPENQLLYGAQDVKVLETIFNQQVGELTNNRLLDVARIEFSCLPGIAEIENNGVLIDQVQWRAIIEEKKVEALRHQEKVIETFGPAILRSRTRKYDDELKIYAEWERARDLELVHLKSEYEARKGVLEVGWGEFKNIHMKEWRERNPNPGKPKNDTTQINVSSATQLKEAFFEMDMEVPSTAADVLEEYAATYPILFPIVELRRSEKFVNSFGESLLKFVDAVDGRIHPDYVQIGASTGRMSCTRPNWQQIPSRSETGKRLRGCVVAATGNSLITSDFSNIELRILADVTGDAVMLSCFANGEDLHEKTARAAFNLSESVDINERPKGYEFTYRAAGKTTNFVIVYGGGPGTLSKKLKIDLDRAKRLINGYSELYPGVWTWIREQKSRVLSEMKSRTLSGRYRLYSLPPEPQFPFHLRNNTELVKAFYELKREWTGQRAEIEREGVNAVIQGTSADITKYSISLFHSRLHEISRLDEVKLVAVVHDELVVEAPIELVKEAQGILESSMYDACKHFLKRVSVPPTEAHVANYWSK